MHLYMYGYFMYLCSRNITILVITTLLPDHVAARQWLGKHSGYEATGISVIDRRTTHAEAHFRHG